MNSKHAAMAGLFLTATLVVLLWFFYRANLYSRPENLRDIMLAPGPDLTRELASGNRSLVEAAISGLYTKAHRITREEADLAIYAATEPDLISDQYRRICLNLFGKNPLRMSASLASLLESESLVLDSPDKASFAMSAVIKLQKVHANDQRILDSIDSILLSLEHSPAMPHFNLETP